MTDKTLNYWNSLFLARSVLYNDFTYPNDEEFELYNKVKSCSLNLKEFPYLNKWIERVNGLFVCNVDDDKGNNNCSDIKRVNKNKDKDCSEDDHRNKVKCISEIKDCSDDHRDVIDNGIRNKGEDFNDENKTNARTIILVDIENWQLIRKKSAKNNWRRIKKIEQYYSDVTNNINVDIIMFATKIPYYETMCGKVMNKNSSIKIEDTNNNIRLEKISQSSSAVTQTSVTDNPSKVSVTNSHSQTSVLDSHSQALVVDTHLQVSAVNNYNKPIKSLNIQLVTCKENETKSDLADHYILIALYNILKLERERIDRMENEKGLINKMDKEDLKENINKVDEGVNANVDKETNNQGKNNQGKNNDDENKLTDIVLISSDNIFLFYIIGWIMHFNLPNISWHTVSIKKSRIRQWAGWKTRLTMSDIENHALDILDERGIGTQELIGKTSKKKSSTNAVKTSLKNIINKISSTSNEKKIHNKYRARIRKSRRKSKSTIKYSPCRINSVIAFRSYALRWVN